MMHESVFYVHKAQKLGVCMNDKVSAVEYQDVPREVWQGLKACDGDYEREHAFIESEIRPKFKALNLPKAATVYAMLEWR